MRLFTQGLISVSVYLYRCLLLLYPAPFRWDYGEEMIQLFRDLCWDEIREGRGCLGLLKVWVCVLSELRGTTREQHLIAGSYYRFHHTLTRVWLVIISALFLFGG
ncbi:MAG TPA: hypothetical protein DDZ80_05585 [Cyanobacteria bacterium UBA8803]|nr:hypothetical protein [Cyanobacteria bacterium UBA9273]HBL58009.1 hypothetical protein [Cyanobacteria bacterium UBA8803]